MCKNARDHVLANGSAVHLGQGCGCLLHVRAAKIDRQTHVNGVNCLPDTLGWFKKPSPAIFAPCDFLAVALFLCYINIKFSGDWFISFAMPITAFVALIVCSVMILCYYLRAGYLYIFGGASILFSLFFVVLEQLMHITFGISHPMLWSPYPAATFFILGISLIIIAIVPQFRESLRKVFSI